MTDGWDRSRPAHGVEVTTAQPVEVGAQVIRSDDGSPVLYLTVKHMRDVTATVIRLRDSVEVAVLSGIVAGEVANFQELERRQGEREQEVKSENDA